MFDDSSWLTVRWLFLRGLALIVLLAIVSLHLQLPGLVGPQGILPIIEGLEHSGYDSTITGFLTYPTLAWWLESFEGVMLLSWIGMGLCLLLLFDVFPKLVLFLLWLVYLSLFVAGQQFTSYQWDLLITESLFCSIFYAPGNVRPGGPRSEPSRLSVVLMRFILFKLMFLGGAAKLLSGDDTWWGLTALHYHFETQPLPTALSWYVDKLPSLVLSVGVIFTLIVEIVVPFCVFLRRRLRRWGVVSMVTLQGVIFLTGNYGVFNLHTILLCLPVLGDRDLSALTRWARQYGYDREDYRGTDWINLGRVGSVAVVILLGLNVFVLSGSLGLSLARGPIQPVWQSINRFRTINGYGLFASMTTIRREIIVQGSQNGRTWKNYEFAYKPNTPEGSPPLVAPHMPRLDWQMWFAALKPVERVRWFPSFVKGLLTGSKPVENLLRPIPFPGDPPRFIRAVMYRYEFSGWGSDGWWNRTNRRLYLPPVTLQNGRLRRVRFDR